MRKLYHATTSVCSIKVRVGLAEIGLDYDEEVLDLQAGDQTRPDYLALNPAGVVPTLVEDGLTVVESSLILEYLDRQHNDSALMPKDRAEEVAARHWLLRCLGIHAAINTMTFSTAMRDRILASGTEEEIEAKVQAMPDPVMRDKRRDLLAKGLQSGHVTGALRTLEATFRDMTRQLQAGDWVTGAEFGIADIALVAYVDRLWRLGFEGLWQGRHDRIGDWLGAMQARPSYATEVAGRIAAGDADKLRAAGGRHWPALGALVAG